MNMPNRERRDWGLVIFIIPIGIFLIVIVGQLAIGLFPNWRINADMSSNLDPNSAPGQPASLLQPLLPQILTPMAWAESYLTPGADISFPPFFVIEPTSTASPSPTPVSPTPTTATPTASATPSPTVVVTSTTPPPNLCEDPSANNFGDPLPCVYPPTTCQDNTATNFGGPLPCVYPPTTCQDPLATNFGGPLPCTYPPTTCQDPLATNFGGPLPCTYPPTGYPSTIDPGYGTPVTPIPSQIGSTPGPPDNPYGSNTGLANINQGTYIVINYSIVVASTPDANYDLVLYEYNNFGNVYLDWVIIGISNNSDGSSYYEVFNWGNGIPDNNSNVGDVAGAENDEQQTNLSELHDPDEPDGTNDNQTGILIDVDNASSQPPPNTYNYIVVIAPNGGGSTEVDSIDVTEVPIPTP